MYDPETCLWMAALALAGEVAVRAVYWMTCAQEGYWPGMGAKA